MNTRHCLLLHGFTGGPYEVQPLADALTQIGYSCTVPMLPGHEGDLRQLAGVTWHDWLEQSAAQTQALTARYGPIDLVGFSMGGLISAYLANRYPVRRLVLLSAAAIYVSPVRFVQHAVERIRLRDFEHWRRVKRTPLRATLQFMRLAKHARGKELPAIAVPTLVVQGLRDQIVHPRSAKYIYSRLKGEKELVWLPDSRHVVCADTEKDKLFEAVIRFLQTEPAARRADLS